MNQLPENLKELSGQVGSVTLGPLINHTDTIADYSAKDNASGQARMVRVISKEAPKGRLQRFLKNIEISKLFETPSYVRTYESGEQEEYHYAAMDLVATDLKTHVQKKGGRLPWQDAAGIVASIADALALAHIKKIIHRDIKPTNVFFLSNNDLCLGGFGLALQRSAEAEQQSAHSAAVGTPAYMPPEQFRNPQNLDYRADFYSLGIVLYELIAGERPFKSDEFAALLQEHEKKEPPSLSKFVDELPPLLVEFVNRLLAKRPDWRYELAETVASDLRAIQAGTLEELTEDEKRRDSRSFNTNIPDDKRQDSHSFKPLTQEPLTLPPWLVKIFSSQPSVNSQDELDEREKSRKLISFVFAGISAIGLIIFVVYMALPLFDDGTNKDKAYGDFCRAAKTAMEVKDYESAKFYYEMALYNYPEREKAKTGLANAVKALKGK
jgi:serine/threonine protein kinase